MTKHCQRKTINKYINNDLEIFAGDANEEKSDEEEYNEKTSDDLDNALKFNSFYR